MLLATVLSLAGLGFICWLLFSLAVFALPFFAAVSAGLLAYQGGAGPIGAIVVALLVGALVLVLGQTLFATARSPWLRAAIAAAYAIPAALAGYHAVFGLSAIGGTADLWRQVFGGLGALFIGGVAWARISAFYPGGAGRGVAEPVQPRSALGAANDG